ncbi:hypothetical protein Sinac_7262 [Singulisphaera acidiphila DSM 18658]|uniref:Uncharacterized protein n=2 Tax=Singulisphaera acidiphila TaxID=466153 RepID=L0DPK7_SINAD|nr:hypothetical protein Sinac_7262 [Singulisphaera acidiphila DSM 18658]
MWPPPPPLETKRSRMTTPSTSTNDRSVTRPPPPVLGRLLNGSFWLALQIPLQAVFSIWSLRLIIEAIGPEQSGAYRFAYGFSFIQFLLEFASGSALQRQISTAWIRGDRAQVNRAIACGTNFYVAMAIVQAMALLSVAHLALPHTEFEGESYRLVVRLLWLQAVTAPIFGISMVVSSVLQAARLYDFLPRYELAITVLRFMVLVLGVKVGLDFFWVIVAQTAVIIVLRIGPALKVMVFELGYRLHLRGARWDDYKILGQFSFYVTLLQISAVLADKVDTTILGFILTGPGPHIAVYDVVSKPFALLRQSGWMLASLVMPAVASLAASHDERGLERIKYDGTRMHIGVLLPIGLLAWIYARPFLSLWFGRSLGYDAAEVAPLMRLYLIAAIPLVLAVPVQMAIGLNKIKVIAMAALFGSLVNLPLSCYLTARLGVAGVIWGTVLTALPANLLVPGLCVLRGLQIDPWTYLRRTLGAPLIGAAALITSAFASRLLMPIADHAPTLWSHTLPLALHLALSLSAYIIFYSLIATGHGDLSKLVARIRRR